MEPNRHAGSEPLDHEVGLHADHRVVGPRHPDVRHRGRSPRLDAGVVRLHVRVRAENGRHSPVEHARERDLLARCLGMKVDDDDGSFPACLLDELVGDEEGVNCRAEEELTLQIDDGDGGSVLRLANGEAPTRQVLAEIRGADDPRVRREHGDEVAMPPDVISECHDVGACPQELIGELRRETHPVSGVLAVHDAEADAEVVTKLVQRALDRPAAGGPEDVADEEDPQSRGRAS